MILTIFLMICWGKGSLISESELDGYDDSYDESNNDVENYYRLRRIHELNSGKHKDNATKIHDKNSLNFERERSSHSVRMDSKHRQGSKYTKKDYLGTELDNKDANRNNEKLVKDMVNRRARNKKC